MKIEFWYIGKTNEKYLIQGMDIFRKRLKHYCNFKEVLLKDVKPGHNALETKARESEMILSKISNGDYLILLDEAGKEFSSEKFAAKIEQFQLRSTQKIIFLVAGAFGADKALKERANLLLSLSKMTFSHQMVRLFFLEQLYRAFTIIKNEKYHNS